MIKKETVLILGAGASAPYEFPSGQRLKDLVCHGADADVQHTGIDMHDYGRFKSALRLSGCSSVDTFLESRPEYIDFGKAAIATVLSPMEKTGNLFGKWDTIRLKPNISQDYRHNWPWYDFLLGVLCDGVPFSAIGDNKLSVITFNYDRSFEHFLFTALKNRYGKPDNECAKVLSRIPVVHVYGSLGKLEWQDGAKETNTVPYDSGSEPRYTKMAADSIQILHEGSENTSEFIMARELLNSAEQVLFLGFAYHPMNVARLGIGPQLRLPTLSRGTALGLSKERREHFDSLTQSKRPSGRPPGEQLVVGGSILIDTDAYTLLYNHVTFG